MNVNQGESKTNKWKKLWDKKGRGTLKRPNIKVQNEQESSEKIVQEDIECQTSHLLSKFCQKVKTKKKERKRGRIEQSDICFWEKSEECSRPKDAI